MSQPTIPPYVPTPNPGLKDLLDAMKTDILLSTNCHAIATVEAFSQDAATGRFKVTASVNYSRTYFVKDSTGVLQPVLKPYPLLIDCPAIVLGGGNVALQFPIAVGDQCLILFNDRDINNWWAGANTGPVASAQLHSMSSGVALVGFQHVGTYDPAHAQFTNGDAKVGVQTSGSLVQIANNTTSLLTLINQFQSIVNTFMGSASTAVSAAQIATAAGVAHGSLASLNFDTLLE